MNSRPDDAGGQAAGSLRGSSPTEPLWVRFPLSLSHTPSLTVPLSLLLACSLSRSLSLSRALFTLSPPLSVSRSLSLSLTHSVSLALSTPPIDPALPLTFSSDKLHVSRPRASCGTSCYWQRRARVES